MITADVIKQHIEASLSCELVQIEGDDGYHFQAIIVSSKFRGKRMIQQHQLVYQALGEKMKQDIHALSMKTYTPEEWTEKP
ncbi:MAG: BolA/IbaG family iron-sulfur metabolism protein [Nitrosomonas sp.]|nr:BolA/IbaG family iron-sulfur metabolism protein [Nitrosomonas sp.]MCW5608459.1 BolA/IbaG family iron-sulfur metabolism protein [Nitrosomonas sp.]